jgi:rhodanese-related sulfurtransferase
VPGAVNLPMSIIGEKLDELPEGAFDVICQVGGRSARVVQALESRGYDVTNVEGGTGEWAASGFPIER